LNIFQQHTFKFNKEYTGEISGFYNSPSISQGTFKSIAMWAVDAGLLKTILKGQGTLKLSVSDIFNSMQWQGTSQFGGQFSKVDVKWESRQFKANFAYRFGNTLVKSARQRKTSQEEETQRVNSDGGPGGVNR